MQTLWTRVAQVRGSCRCPQCLHAAQGIARRAGTANTNVHTVRPKYWTSSTLWYSGIFAAAATFDASVKKQRREQWDKAIAEVKQELGQDSPLDQTRVDERDAADAALLSEGIGIGVYEAEHKGATDEHAGQILSKADELIGDAIPLDTPGVEGNTINFTPIDDPDIEFKQGVARYVDSSTRRKSRAQWPANTGHDLKVYHLPPQSIYASDWQKTKVEAKRWSQKKVGAVELQTEILMMRFFEWLSHHKEGRDSVIEEAAGAVPPLFASHIRHYANLPANKLNKAFRYKYDDAQRLRDTPGVDPGQPFEFQRDSHNTQLCNYAQVDMGQYQDILNDMNTSIREVFDQADSSTLTAPQYLAKVFYNLFISSAPPDVDTFNTLITRLHRLEHLSLTRHTVLSFLRANIRPNEVSLAAILNFRTDVDDKEGFRYILEIMTGKRQQFLMAAAPWNRKPQGSWYHGNRILPRDDHMVQKPYATPMVFTALLRGVLRFDGFDHVLRVTEAWAKEGWGLDVNGLSILLKDCADRDDWTAGVAVWRQIQCLLRPAKMEITTCTFADMLHLCTRAGEKEMFKGVMELAFKVHRKAVKSGALIDLVKERQEARRSKKTEKPESLGKMPPAAIRQSSLYDSSSWRALRREEEPRELVSGSPDITAEDISVTDLRLGESCQVDASAQATSMPLDGLGDSIDSQRPKHPEWNREEVVAKKAENKPVTDPHPDELHQVDPPARAAFTPLNTFGNSDGTPHQAFKAWEESQQLDVPEWDLEMMDARKSHDTSQNRIHQ